MTPIEQQLENKLRIWLAEGRYLDVVSESFLIEENISKLPIFLLLRGLAFVQAGNLYAAKFILEQKLLPSFPDSYEFYRLEAEILYAEGNFSQALKLYNSLLEKYPGDTEILERLYGYYSQNQFAQNALEILNQLETFYRLVIASTAKHLDMTELIWQATTSFGLFPVNRNEQHQLQNLLAQQQSLPLTRQQIRAYVHRLINVLEKKAQIYLNMAMPREALECRWEIFSLKMALPLHLFRLI